MIGHKHIIPDFIFSDTSDNKAVVILLTNIVRQINTMKPLFKLTL